jgi:HK97 family phage prohead protease
VTEEAVETKDFPFEIKADDVTDEGIFKGYAAAFNNIDSWDDIIKPGAFQNTLKKGNENIPILWYHDPYEPIGLPTEMREDKKGLYVEGKLSLKLQTAQDTLVRMQDGLVKGLSIGFRAVKFDFEKVKDRQIRNLHEIDLIEFSPVTFPANKRAKITSVKSLIKSANTPFELERGLRDAGLTRTEAKYLATRHKFDSPCDASEIELLTGLRDLLRDQGETHRRKRHRGRGSSR